MCLWGYIWIWLASIRLSKADCSTQRGWASSNLLGARAEQIKEEKKEKMSSLSLFQVDHQLFPILELELTRAVLLVRPSDLDQNYTIDSPHPQVYALKLELHHQPPPGSISSLQTAARKISAFLYHVSWFCTVIHIYLPTHMLTYLGSVSLENPCLVGLIEET